MQKTGQEETMRYRLKTSRDVVVDAEPNGTMVLVTRTAPVTTLMSRAEFEAMYEPARKWTASKTPYGYTLNLEPENPALGGEGFIIEEAAAVALFDFMAMENTVAEREAAEQQERERDAQEVRAHEMGSDA
jgi:hypothetical protein